MLFYLVFEFVYLYLLLIGLSWWLSGKESAYNAGDMPWMRANTLLFIPVNSRHDTHFTIKIILAHNRAQ